MFRWCIHFEQLIRCYGGLCQLLREGVWILIRYGCDMIVYVYTRSYISVFDMLFSYIELN
jgi:hypothetical protein